jgi:hypothetical protein
MMYRYYSKLRTALCHSYKCNRQYSVSQLEKVVAGKIAQFEVMSLYLCAFCRENLQHQG